MDCTGDPFARTEALGVRLTRETRTKCRLPQARGRLNCTHDPFAFAGTSTIGSEEGFSRANTVTEEFV